MSDLQSETNIFTEPSGYDVGTSVRAINIDVGTFDQLFLSGTDLSTVVTDISAHVSATAAHGATGAVVGTTNTQTLSNKTLNVPNLIASDIRSTSGSFPLNINTLNLTALRTYTFPDASGSPFVVLDRGTGQSINQTLSFTSDPVITNIRAGNVTNTLVLPQTNDTLVARGTTDTLTNKTLTNPVISLPVNNDADTQLLTRNTGSGALEYRNASTFSSAATTISGSSTTANWTGGVINVQLVVMDSIVNALFSLSGIMTQTSGGSSPLISLADGSIPLNLITSAQHFVFRGYIDGILQVLGLVVALSGGVLTWQISLADELGTSFPNGTTFVVPATGYTVTWQR